MDLRRRGRAKKQRVRELESQAINLRQESAIVDYGLLVILQRSASRRRKLCRFWVAEPLPLLAYHR